MKKKIAININNVRESLWCEGQLAVSAEQSCICRSKFVQHYATVCPMCECLNANICKKP